MNIPTNYQIEQSSPTVRINKFFPFAFIYFFINIVGLPFGLTWTAVLGPVFYAWVLLKGGKDVFLPFIALLSPFIIVQMAGGIEFRDYAISFLNLLMIYFFAMAVRIYLRQDGDREKIFRWIVYINFILCLIALILYFTPLQHLVWIRQNITEGVQDFWRLKMFTYEASHYATLFVPIFVFYFLQYLLEQNKIPAMLLIPMIFLPLMLSFSFGVLGSLLLAGLIVFFIGFRQLARKRRVLNAMISLSVIIGVLFMVLFLFFPDNILFERVANIFSGQDTSAEGRTGDAFRLATKILDETNSTWFGIGPGQLKYEGGGIIREYYLYYDSTSVAIPNVAAETLLLFGWLGFGLRMLILIALFFITRTWSSYFRLTLFLFMFIYQFTGSYITNPAEWVIWVLAFTSLGGQGHSVKGNTDTEKLRDFFF